MQRDAGTALRVEQEAALEQITEVEQIATELSLRVDRLESRRPSADSRGATRGNAGTTTQGAMLAEDLVSSGCVVISLYLVIFGFAMATTLVAADLLTPNRFLYQYMYGKDGRQTHCVPAIPTEAHNAASAVVGTINASEALATSRHIYAASAVVGQVRTDTLLSSVLVLVSFTCVVLAVFVPALVVTFMPWKVQNDFEQSGTLSNLGQDVRLPRGRVFTTMLFTAGFLLMASGYTHHIYENWFYNSRRNIDVLYHAYQNREEKIARSAWAVIPSVGYMLTALLPTRATNDRQMLLLNVIHNFAAPSGLIFAAFMETYQLGYGENAFAYFFCSNEVASWMGALTWVQRIRVIMLCSLWIIGGLFVCMQVYFSLPILGMKIKTSYSFALWSLYLQITTLLLAQGLPTIQALDCLLEQMGANYLFETAAQVETLIPPGNVMPVLGSLMESDIVSHRFLRPAQRANFAKQLFAGADGQPLFQMLSQP